MFEKFFKNGGFFAFLLLVGFAVIYFSAANAAPGDAKDIAYHQCAQNAVVKWQTEKTQLEQDTQMCTFFNAKYGQECATVLAGMMQVLGQDFFMQQVDLFIYQEIVIPECGEHTPH